MILGDDDNHDHDHVHNHGLPRVLFALHVSLAGVPLPAAPGEFAVRALAASAASGEGACRVGRVRRVRTRSNATDALDATVFLSCAPWHDIGSKHSIIQTYFHVLSRTVLGI